MPFQPAVNCAMATTVFTRLGETMINTYYARFPSLYEESDLQALADAVDDWMGTEMLPNLGSDVNYVSTEVRGLAFEFDQVANADAFAGVGGSGGSAQANSVAFCVKRRSAFTGRGARGRVYLPTPPSAAFDTDNTVSPTWANAVTASLNLLRASMTAAGWEEVILHRISAGVPLVTATIFTLVEYDWTDIVVDNQRGRLPNH